jgi:hypothetical protein
MASQPRRMRLEKGKELGVIMNLDFFITGRHFQTSGMSIL